MWSIHVLYVTDVLIFSDRLQLVHVNAILHFGDFFLVGKLFSRANVFRHISVVLFPNSYEPENKPRC